MDVATLVVALPAGDKGVAPPGVVWAEEGTHKGCPYGDLKSRLDPLRIHVVAGRHIRSPRRISREFPMKFRLLKRLLPFLCLLLWGESLWAVQPRKWVAATRDEFLKGKLRGVSVTSDARLIIAPALELLVNTEEPFVYSAVVDGLGNVYLGTGNDGKVFRIGANGESKEWARLDEPGVYAMALDSAGRVYAGTAPDGKVYRLDLTGKAEIFFDPDEKYIWSLAVDRRDNVYVGTGSRGIVYKVGSGGEGRKFYDSPTTHIVSLAWDVDRNILAGTSARALILRLSPEGGATVVHDSPLEEVRSIAVDRYGNIYAAALSGGAAGGLPEAEGHGQDHRQGRGRLRLHPRIQPAPCGYRGPLRERGWRSTGSAVAAAWKPSTVPTVPWHTIC